MALVYFLDDGDPVVLNTDAVAYVVPVKDTNGEGCEVFFVGVDNPRRFYISFEDLLALLDITPTP